MVSLIGLFKAKAFAWVSHISDLDVTFLTFVQTLPSIVTDGGLPELEKFVPDRVKAVPPSGGPKVGETDVMTGGGPRDQE